MRFKIDMCNGSLNWGTNHWINGCVSSDIQTPNIYDFDKRKCTKLTGPGVSLQLSERRQNRNEMSAQLTPGLWIEFNSTEDICRIIWIGRAISKPEWENFCILKNDSSGNKNIEVVSVGRNGCVIHFQWYTQKVVGVLEFFKDDNPPIVHSNIYLVLVGFDEYMHQEHGSITRVPRRRTVRSNCMDDFGLFPERVNLHTYERDWYRRYSGNICRMNTQVRYKPFEKSSLD